MSDLYSVVPSESVSLTLRKLALGIETGDGPLVRPHLWPTRPGENLRGKRAFAESVEQTVALAKRVNAAETLIEQAASRKRSIVTQKRNREKTTTCGELFQVKR